MVIALQAVSKVVGNLAFERIILRSAEEVKKGGNISNVFDRAVEMPPIVSKMIKIGEETGRLTETLRKVASFYDQEVNAMTRNITTMIEPILICVLGFGVGIMVFAVLMPIYDVANKIQ